MTAKVEVSVRVRPPSSTSGAAVGIDVSESGDVTAKGKEFSYAQAVVIGSDQGKAYQAICAPMVSRLLEGYSCTLLAYGQTGSGKTHTMFGPPGSLTEASLVQASGGVPTAWGLFPRTVLELLRHPDLGTLHASAVEVYQDRAYDLLADRSPLTVGSKSAGRKVAGGPADVFGRSGQKAHGGAHPRGCHCGKCWAAGKAEIAARLAARDAIKAGGKGAERQPGGSCGAPTASSLVHSSSESFSTVGETLLHLKTPADVARLALTVEVTRTAQGHALNARSSRSHCLVHLHVTQHNGDGKGKKVARRQLLFVDLAGSERIARSGVEGGMRLQATTINQSLTALGNVIRALNSKSVHVPFRANTLTMLLRSSFGGQSYTAVVISVSSDAADADESACSLEFGGSMATVRNPVSVVTGTDESSDEQVASLRVQAEALRTKIAEMSTAGLGGRFGPNSCHSDQTGFLENQRRLEEYGAEARRAKSAITEANAQAACGDTAAAARVSQLRKTLEKAQSEASNLQGIIARQKSIKGFWIEPTPAYNSRVSQFNALEARIAMLEQL